MKNIQYQQKAVSELVEKTIRAAFTQRQPPYTHIQGADRQRKDRYGIGDAHAAER